MTWVGLFVFLCGMWVYQRLTQNRWVEVSSRLEV